jgi:hypothetical protein
MKLFKYKDYNDYIENQIEANKRKINNSYVDPNSLGSLINYLYEELNIEPNLILCHGTRRGLEQQYFIDYYDALNLKPEVIGTEISPTAKDYPHTIQWDFHDTKPEWIGNTDIIYTNSFDHSCKPEECLDIWMSCLNKNGVCVIEYSPICDNKSQAADPFGATLDEYKSFISKKYNIVDILKNDGIEDKGQSYRGVRYFIVISNNHD